MASSDITWLPNSLLKGINIPNVVIVDHSDEFYSGGYAPSTNTIFVINYAYTHADDISSIIAHEFCHHLQYQTTDWGHGSGWDSINVLHELMNSHISYDDMIRAFYKNLPYEMEALLFQNKYAKSESSEWQLRKLVLRS